MTHFEKLDARLEELRTRSRSAWERGVAEAAEDLFDWSIDESGKTEAELMAIYADRNKLRKLLLNGASSWLVYSWGGSALCYDEDIARRYCTPSELRRTANGSKRPNSREEWLDVQARALHQACSLLWATFQKIVLGV